MNREQREGCTTQGLKVLAGTAITLGAIDLIKPVLESPVAVKFVDFMKDAGINLEDNMFTLLIPAIIWFGINRWTDKSSGRSQVDSSSSSENIQKDR